MRGSNSARVSRSQLARVHREIVIYIVEDEVDGQEEGQDDQREDDVTHDVRTANTRLEPRMCV